MSNIPDYGPPLDEDEIARIAALLARTFHFPVEHARPYLDSAGVENVRVVRAGSELQGALVVSPMGQWFGGRSVPMGAIAAVGIAPQHRGRGAGARLMRRVVEELHAAGTALSALYPATQPLYRRQGYEQAGAHFEVRLPTHGLDSRERGLEILPVGSDDQPAVEQLYRDWARHTTGNLDRNAFIWRRVRRFKGEDAAGYAIRRGAQVEGYVYYIQKPREPFGYNLHVTDFVVSTPDSARRLLAFFADHRSMVDEVSWRSGSTDPLLLLCREQRHTRVFRDYWMLRIVHAAAALAARGYPPAVRAELHLEIHDDILPANNGRLIVEVAEGRAAALPGGRGNVRLDVRALASLYSGFVSPHELAAIGHLTAPDADLETAAALFSGPPPWMRDPF